MTRVAATEAFTNPKNAKFYPLEIPVPHPQLRHLISTVNQDWVYFVSNDELYALHLPSKRKSLIWTLPFSPRCLVAGLGWVCVGGEQKGISAFIRLDKEKILSRFQVDEPPPVRLSSSDREESKPDSTRYPELVLNELGGSIINSITLHELLHFDSPESSEPVALLSNNDATVKIFSLHRLEVVANLQHRVAINYALISPDSKILVAVGDSPSAFFYRRSLSAPKLNLQAHRRKYAWELVAKPRLTCGDCTSDDHSFAISFSPSGHLCAISAQGGVISVFDMERITMRGIYDPESYQSSLACSFSSSRSGDCGFVRSMAFSPAPWDLLAWAEDHGHAVIADVRQAFSRRQTLALETRSEGVERIPCEDLTDTENKDDNSHNDRSRPRSDRAQPSFVPPSDSYFMAAGQRLGSVHTAPGDLDPREQSILDTLEVDGSTNHIAPAAHLDRGRSNQPEHLSHSQEPPDSLFDMLRERNSLRAHSITRQHQTPRRRSSLMLLRGQGPSTSASSRFALDLARIVNSPVRIANSPVRMTDDDAADETHRPMDRVPSNGPVFGSRRRDSQVMGLSSLRSGQLTPSELMNELSSPTTATLRTATPDATPLNHHEPLGADISGRDPSTDSSVNQQTSARTSALPTTYRADLSTGLPSSGTQNIISRDNQPLSEAEQVRQQVIGEAELAAVDGQTPSLVTNDDHHGRLPIPQSRNQERRAPGIFDNQPPPSRTLPSLRRIQNIQRSELTAGATVTELRFLRQIMAFQSARSNSLDGNGNWTAGETLARVRAHSSSRSLMRTIEHDIATGIGVGTAGLGWSQDGRQLYIGTEEGILCYPMELRDRKFFPVFAFR